MASQISRTLWGRYFDLDVDFKIYTGEEVSPSQKEALAKLLDNWDVVEGALDKLKEYCLSENGDEIGSDQIDNIFRYVIPTTLYVLQDEDPQVVSLLCEYRFDPEHGIALRFENEKLAEIGPQDIAL